LNRRLSVRQRVEEWSMTSGARCVVVGAGVAVLLLHGASAVAQKSLLKSVELCNGVDRSSPDRQISGCTALIESDGATTPALVTAHNNRGNAYAARGDFNRAILDYDQSIKLNSNYARAYNNRGVAYQKKGEYSRAINDFDEAIRLNPNNSNAFANRAETYSYTGDYALSVRDYDEAIRLRPMSDMLWNGRCWARIMLGELPAALADCNEALRLEPRAATFDSRGLGYLKMGKWDLAVDDYNSALRLDPKLASALYGRGLAKLKKGDTIGGNVDIGAAKKLETNIGASFARYGVP
jgi:tetratricopeptide (TPR) repeat protein